MIKAADGSTPPRNGAAIRAVLWESDAARAERVAPMLARGHAGEVLVVSTAEQLERELRTCDVRILALSRRSYGAFHQPSLFPELILLYEESAELEWHYVLPVTGSAAAPLAPKRSAADERIAATGADRRIRLLRPAEITWARAAGRSTIVAAGNAQYRVNASVTELLRRLQEHGFVRVNRSVLVRTDAIRELQPLPHGNYVALMEDGTSFVTSRQRDVLGDIQAGAAPAAGL